MTARKGRARRWLLLLGLAVAVLWRLRHGRASSGPRSADFAGGAAPEPVRAPTAESAEAAAPPEQPVEAAPPPAEPVETAATEADGPEAEALPPAEAARILGCGPDELAGLLNGGPSTRESVEKLASEHYRWRRHVDDPDSYWVTLKQASTILGVSSQKLKRLLDEGEVPYVVHRDGVRLMRRSQLDAAARAARSD